MLIPALIVIKLVLPGTLGAIKQSFLPPGVSSPSRKSNRATSGSGRLADIGPALQEWKQQPLWARVSAPESLTRSRGSGQHPRRPVAGNTARTGVIGFFGWLWFFVRVVRRFGAEAKEDDSDRGWLLVAIAASVAAFGVGMLTYDAFSFIQVTFLLFILVGIGSAVLAERPTPVTGALRADSNSR